MTVLLICYSVAPCICKDVINVCAICPLLRFILVDWYTARLSQVSSCCFGRAIV